VQFHGAGAGVGAGVLLAVLALVLAGPTSFASRESPRRVEGARGEHPLDGDFADPFVLPAGDDYYAFGTGAHGLHVQVARSRDLSSWARLEDALPALPAWAAREEGLTWAPSVLTRGSSFVLYYTTRDAASGFQCISRALAASPAGPYVDRSRRSLVCQVAGDERFCGSIDPSPVVDADGSPYLLWKSDENSAACHRSPRIWSQRLSPDGRELVGSPTALLARDSSWEGDIVEAPSMARHDGRYFLFYSANWYASADYAIGYASCTSPAGPCKKESARAPLFASSGDLLGPGGQEVFAAADGGLWLAYHAWTAPGASYAAGGARSLRLGRLDFSAGGVPRISPALDSGATGTPPRR